MTEDQLREAVRDALTAYRNHLAGMLAEGNPDDDRDHLLVSQTQVETAMRVLWMDV